AALQLRGDGAGSQGNAQHRAEELDHRQPGEGEQRSLRFRIELDAMAAVRGEARQEQQPQKQQRDTEGADVDAPPQRLPYREPGQGRDPPHQPSPTSAPVTVRTKKSSSVSRRGTIACSRPPCPSTASASSGTRCGSATRTS